MIVCSECFCVPQILILKTLLVILSFELWKYTGASLKIWGIYWCIMIILVIYIYIYINDYILLVQGQVCIGGTTIT